MKVVPGTNGKKGLSILETKFAGSITGSYGAGPNFWQAACRTSCPPWQVSSASARSVAACFWQSFRVAGSEMLTHFPKATLESLSAAPRQAEGIERRLLAGVCLSPGHCMIKQVAC